MGDVSPHFSYYEFGCRCGLCELCDGRKIDKDLVYDLEYIYSQVEGKVWIISGCTCEYWNKKLGRSKDSYHLPRNGCRAVTLRCEDDCLRYKIMQAAFQLNLSVSLERGRIEIDNRRRPKLSLY